MTLNERPGVYSSYEVTSSIRGTSLGSSVGLCAISAKTVAETPVKISSRAQALENFGASVIAEMCSLALQNGASEVFAVPVLSGATVSDYTNAFSKLCMVPEIRVMMCDSRDMAVVEAMKDEILTASENFKYRIGVAEVSGAISAMTAMAEGLNCERMVLLSAPSDVENGYCTAAFVGAVASTTDPAIPLNGAELFGLNSAVLYTDSDVNEMVRGGVTVLENSGSSLTVLRAVTTKTETGGAPDTTWRELTTIRIIDEVIPGIRDALRLRFTRAKNTEQTRGAIKTQVVIELQDRLTRQIIDGYGEVTAVPSESDPTVCEVAFEFTVAYGLNHIQLMAKITV